ncbi:MAG TPA: glycosyltransferase [Hellea balneolensis]|uniref:Glycosyltransferase n=1 Tax=Hellea balneolensis TaxID=287478 RepID=A0A7C5M1J3_9PROT|nr:glycosyltransferase [Hellea balneolensis]
MAKSKPVTKHSNLIILLPVYEDRQALRHLLVDLKKELGSGFVVCAVDDGSLNAPPLLEDFQDVGVNGEIIRLRRNVGHQKAIAAGLCYINENYNFEHVVIMDSDGEDKPSTIKDLLAVLTDDKIDVAVAERRSRVESLKFKVFYFFYKIVFGLLTGRPVSFGNFMALKPGAVARMCTINELWLHIAGAVILSRLRIQTVAIDRGSRYAGQSKMNFPSLVLHGFRGIMVFTEDVLVRVGIACFLLLIPISFAVVLTLVLKLVGMASPGWFSSAMALLFIILIQIGFLNLMMLLVAGMGNRQPPTTEIRLQNLIMKIEETV